MTVWFGAVSPDWLPIPAHVPGGPRLAAWALGGLTRLASVGIACTMATAFYMHTFMHGDPFVPMEPKLVPTSEPAAIYFCVALVLMTLGPGRISADAKLFGRRKDALPRGFDVV